MKLRAIVGPDAIFSHLKRRLTGNMQDFASAQDFRDFMQAYLDKQGQGLRPRPATSPAKVYVNHARLLIDCACGAGAMVSIEFRTACCLECGRVYPAGLLVFPSDADLTAIDDIMATRPPTNRNFDPANETVASVRFLDQKDNR
jgi:hypothetical protein